MRFTTVLGLLAGAGLLGAAGYAGWRQIEQQAADRAQLAVRLEMRAEADKAAPLLVSGDLAGALWHFERAYELGARDAYVRTSIPWLEDALDQQVATLATDAAVSAAAFSPDGKTILTGGVDGSVKLWDVTTGARLKTLDGHTGAIASASFARGGQRILTLSEDGSARLWDAVAGTTVATLRESIRPSPPAARDPRAPRAAAPAQPPAGTGLWLSRFSPDGERLLTVDSEHGARLWHGVTGQLITSLTSKAVLTSDGLVALGAWSGDSRRVVTVAGSAAFLWDGQTGQLVAALRGHAERIRDATFSPDGKRVVTCSADQTARLWDGETGALVTTLEGHSGTVYSASFTLAGGKAVMTISADGTARLWDSLTGRSLFPPVGHPRYSQILALSPDGGRMVIVSESEAVELWNRILGNMRAQLEEKVPSEGLVTAFSPSGRRVVTGNPDGSARIWDGKTGQPLVLLKGHRGRVLAVAWSPDSSLVLTGGADQTARLWRSRVEGFPLPIEGHKNEVTAIAWSPDGRRLLTTSRDGSVSAWDGATGELGAELTGHRGAVTSAFFLPGGSGQVITVEPGGVGSGGRIPSTVRRWSADTGQAAGTIGGPLEYGQTLAVSLDGSRALSSGEGKAELWEVGDGKNPGQRLAQLEAAEGVQTAALSADGKLLATAGSAPEVRLWDATSGAPRRVLTGHEGAVRALAFSPDGSRLATGSTDATVRIWQVAGSEPAQILTGHVGEVRSMQWSPDGERLLVVDGSERAWLWDTTSGQIAGALPRFTPRGFVTLAFSPDGSRIASVGEQLRLWDGRSGKMLVLLADKSEVYTAAAWRPDGKVLATGAQSGAVKLWDVHLEDRPLAELHRSLMHHPAYQRHVEALRKSQTTIPYELRVPQREGQAR